MRETLQVQFEALNQLIATVTKIASIKDHLLIDPSPYVQ